MQNDFDLNVKLHLLLCSGYLFVKLYKFAETSFTNLQKHVKVIIDVSELSMFSYCLPQSI